MDVPNIEKQIATRQIRFIEKLARKYDYHLPTKLLTAWCNHKQQSGGVLHTEKRYIVHNLLLIIPEVDKAGTLKTWAHFAIDDRYWQHLISGLGNYSTSTPPAPLPLPLCRAHSPTTLLPSSPPHPPPYPRQPQP